MGVYIKGVMMPKDCETCFVLNSCQHRHYEIIKDEQNGCITKFVKENCPLVEVKEPHGRLVDTDMLQHMIDKTAAEPEYQHTGEDWMVGLYIVESLIDELPTVIESEE